MSGHNQSTKPTIVLVHGAWADGNSWSKVISRLQDDDYTVIAPAVGLGSLSGDSAALRKVIVDLGVPVLLVGHSYGGAVITAAASGLANVLGLVYVAAFAPDVNESVIGLIERFGAQYGAPPVGHALRPDGPLDNLQTLIYLDASEFGDVFAQDIDREKAAVLAATQRPAAVAAFGEPLHSAPAWNGLRSWYLISTEDGVIQPDAQRWMASRIAAEMVEVKSSHATPIAAPREVVKLIERVVKALA
jgi:pimeloyl-ACP methyl ester carboxylesterase